MSDKFISQIIKEDKFNARRKHRKDFETFDRHSLSDMDDRALAAWQADFEQDEAQWRLAEHEWQRRLTAEQITATMQAARGQAWFGIAGVIIGVLFGVLVPILIEWLRS